MKSLQQYLTEGTLKLTGVDASSMEIRKAFQDAMGYEMDMKTGYRITDILDRGYKLVQVEPFRKDPENWKGNENDFAFLFSKNGNPKDMVLLSHGYGNLVFTNKKSNVEIDDPYHEKAYKMQEIKSGKLGGAEVGYDLSFHWSNVKYVIDFKEYQDLVVNKSTWWTRGELDIYSGHVKFDIVDFYKR